jgi:hypothetical protein
MDRPYISCLTFMPTPLEVAERSLVALIIFCVFCYHKTALLQCHLKGWYRLAEDQAPKACLVMLARHTAELAELYTAMPPPGWLLPINATPTPVPNGPPLHLQIKEVVLKLWNSCAAGAMKMKA